MAQIVQCVWNLLNFSLNTALRNTREIASQFSLGLFVLWTRVFCLLARREFWFVPSTPRGSVRPIFPRDGPFSVTVWLSWIFALFIGLKTLCSPVVSMKTSAARRPEAFSTNCHAYSTLPLNFSHFSLLARLLINLMVHPSTLFAEFTRRWSCATTIQASTAVEIVFKWTASSVLPLEPFFQLYPLHSSGTARPMRSPSLPSSRWCALKTRTELHRRGESPRGKPKGTDGKECRWNRHAKSGIGGRPVSVTMVSRVCSVTMVALDACTPLALVAIQPVTSVEWRRPNVVALGHLVRLSRCWRLPPRCTTPTMVARWRRRSVSGPPLCLPVPVCVMCDVTTCVLCQAELFTPIRNCSVNTELIYRMNNSEQDLGVWSIRIEVYGISANFSFSGFHDSKHWYSWIMDDWYLWVVPPFEWL